MARRKARSPARTGFKNPKKTSKEDTSDKMDVDTFYGGDKDSGGKKAEGDTQRRSRGRQGGAEETPACGRPSQDDAVASTSKCLKGKLPTKCKEVEESYASKKTKRFVLNIKKNVV